MVQEKIQSTQSTPKKDYLADAKNYLLRDLRVSNEQILKGLSIFLIISFFVYLAFFIYYGKSHFLLYSVPCLFFVIFNYISPSVFKKDKSLIVDKLVFINAFFFYFHFVLFLFSDPYFYFLYPSVFFIFMIVIGYCLANNIVFTVIILSFLSFILYIYSYILGSTFKYENGNLNFAYSYPSIFSFYFVISYVSLSFWIIYSISKTLYGMVNSIPNILKLLTEALKNKKEDDRKQLAFKSQLNIAAKLQHMVLPGKEEEKIACEKFAVDVAGRMDPAAEVGGDYYDILIKKDDLYLGIGDVTDHGLDSGLIMLMCQSSFKNSLYEEYIDVKRALMQANKVVYEIGGERMDSGRTMSLSFAKYTRDGEFLLTGQHEKLIVCRQGKEIEWVETDDLGFIIGITDDISENVSEQPLRLEIGDSVLFYTDGANEAENEQKEQMGEKAVGDLFLKYNELSAKKMLDAIYKDIYKFIGKQVVFDDITMVCLKRI